MSKVELAFWTALYNEQSPANYLVFADWCEENEKPDMARTLRWAQKNKKFSSSGWMMNKVVPDDSFKIIPTELWLICSNIAESEEWYIELEINVKNDTPKATMLAFARLCEAHKRTNWEFDNPQA